MILKRTLVAALATATMLTTIGTALAAPGVTLGAVNMRDAPKDGDVIEVLAKGTFVDIEGCSGGWCAIEHEGDEGYVSAKYLALVEDGDEDEDDDDDYDDEDDYDDDDGPSVEVCLGGGGFGGGGFGFGKVCVEDRAGGQPNAFSLP